MENTEIKNKLENIEILLSTFIQTVNDPKKKAEESEALTKAIESINSTQKEISGLISQEKALIENFKPAVEVKNYSINVKEPLFWVAGSIGFMLICFTAAFFTSRHYYNESEYYQTKANEYFDNNFKYKYMKLFWGEETEKVFKAFDKEYDANWAKYNKQIEKRERELDEMHRASDESKLKAKEAMRLRQKADSLRNAK